MRWQPTQDVGAGTFGTLLNLAVYKMQAAHVHMLVKLIKYDFKVNWQGENLIHSLIASKRSIQSK